MVFFRGDRPEEFFIDFPVSGINAAVTDHFEMLFRDMADQALYEFQDGDGFFHIGVIFMAVIVEGNLISIIFVDTRGCNHRPSEIATDIFGDSFGITFIGLCIDIKSMFMILVAGSFHLFERSIQI